MYTHKIVLSDKQIRWLEKHFQNTKNKDIAEKLGISQASLARLARKLQLKKSTQFLKKCYKNGLEKAHLSHMIHGTYPPKGFKIPGREKGQFKKGTSTLQRLGARKEKLRVAKSAETRRQTYKSERARVTFGIPQRTKLRVGKQSKQRICFRYTLRKKGYIVNDDERIAYYNEETKRSKAMEARDQRWYKFQPQ